MRKGVIQVSKEVSRDKSIMGLLHKEFGEFELIPDQIMRNPNILFAQIESGRFDDVNPSLGESLPFYDIIINRNEDDSLEIANVIRRC